MTGKRNPKLRGWKDSTPRTPNQPTTIKQLSLADQARREYAREYRRKNQTAIQLYYASRKRQTKNNALRKWHGIGIEVFEALLEQQNGVCAICHRPESGRDRMGQVKQLAVDHDHATGLVRGLLCDACNNGLGRFKDSATLLESALVYLRQHVSEIAS